MAWQRWWISWGVGVVVMASWVVLELAGWAAYRPDVAEPAMKLQPVVHQPAQATPGYVRI